MYFWNAGIGLIMLVAMGAAALVMQNDLREFIGLLGGALPVMPMSSPQSPMMPSAIHSMGAAQLRDSFTPAALAARPSAPPC